MSGYGIVIDVRIGFVSNSNDAKPFEAAVREAIEKHLKGIAGYEVRDVLVKAMRPEPGTSFKWSELK